MTMPSVPWFGTLLTNIVNNESFQALPQLINLEIILFFHAEH